MSFLGTIAPVIATALGGPLAGAATEFIASKLGVDDKTKENIANTIQGLDPLKAKELDYQFQMYMASQGIQLQMGQIGVNIEEAKSQSTFVAGWRPAVGWVGAFGFAYCTILYPTMKFFAMVLGYKGGFPEIDNNLMLYVLGGILGLGAMRSYDKKQSTNTDDSNDKGNH
jgi:hypothetical protein